MDFFEQQHLARRQTRLMVVMFAVAVVAVVGVLNFFGAALWALSTDSLAIKGQSLVGAVPRELFAGITVISLGFIGFGTGSCMLRLAAGGTAVAEMVGARAVARDSRDPLERRYLNIVEEMSIASGITMPGVYLMDEERGINAFAAGYSPNEAVVAVTRGALETLDRDELQGVIGHEFSHILNGDMRLNIRLMGVVAGIVNIGALGRFLMGGNRHSTSRDNDWRIFLVGLALWIIGSVGVLAGNIIKAAISRQREFLADASAVQFTRNPEGIAGALHKIGEQSALIENRHAEDLSHMYFGEATSSMFGLLDTHPPLDKRIERVMGPGARRLLAERRKRQPTGETASVPASSGNTSQAGGAIAGFAPGAALSAANWGSGEAMVHTSAPALMASVGHPTPAHVDAAREVLNRLPEEIHSAANTPDGARALLFALLLGEGESRARQLIAIERDFGPALAARSGTCADAIRPLGPRVRMPLTGLFMPTLAGLTTNEREAILKLANELALADSRVTLAEFVLLTLCKRHLAHAIKGAPPVKHKNIEAVAKEASLVLGLLAHSGKGGMAAFDKGMQALGIPGGVLHSPSELGVTAVEGALYELKLLAPLKKPAFIKACLAVVMADEKLTVLEGELMRALCAALDSPLPPLLDTLEPVH